MATSKPCRSREIPRANPWKKREYTVDSIYLQKYTGYRITKTEYTVNTPPMLNPCYTHEKPVQTHANP